MILGFKKQFKPLILADKKIHTIREDLKDRWHEGRKIHFATDTRSADYNCFKEGVVKGIQFIFMTYYNYQFEVSIGDDEYCNRYLRWNEIDEIAKKDGFDGYDDFARWFVPILRERESPKFFGKIIHWTDFKY